MCGSGVCVCVCVLVCAHAPIILTLPCLLCDLSSDSQGHSVEVSCKYTCCYNFVREGYTAYALPSAFHFPTCPQGSTVAAIGFKMDLGAMTMRGRINSLGMVAATVEKRLDPIPGVLALSGRINHWTDESKFGIALLIG